MKCNRCGIENGDSNKFCTNCGNILVNEYKPYKIICESCGAENEPGYKYCFLCGELLKTSEITDNLTTDNNIHNNYKNEKSRLLAELESLKKAENKLLKESEKIDWAAFEKAKQSFKKIVKDHNGLINNSIKLNWIRIIKEKSGVILKISQLDELIKEAMTQNGGNK